MKIQTFSILVGDERCNANCPYCISKMTYEQDCKIGKPNWRNFHKACQFAKQNGVSTVILTGKGEPTLFPNQIAEYLEVLSKYNFPFMELQTNGILFGKGELDKYLQYWYSLGLTTIIVSAVDDRHAYNQSIFGKDYPELKQVMDKINSFGFMSRLSIVLTKHCIRIVRDIDSLVRCCKNYNVDQLTIRNLSYPNVCKNDKVKKWVEKNKLDDRFLKEIYFHCVNNSTFLMDLFHGAKVYDYEGQNICLSNCLTENKEDENKNEIRHLIFFPDGRLTYSWTYAGAVLL